MDMLKIIVSSEYKPSTSLNTTKKEEDKKKRGEIWERHELNVKLGMRRKFDSRGGSTREPYLRWGNITKERITNCKTEISGNCELTENVETI